MSAARRRAVLVSAPLLLVFAPPVPADDEAAIERCAIMEDAADRIDCLENALRGEPAHEPEIAPAEEPLRSPEKTGLEKKKPPPEKAAMQVTVTAVTENLLGKLVFETENGQVWLQVDQRVVRLDDTPFAAEIRPATMGSFFLRPDDGGVSIRVRREK